MNIAYNADCLAAMREMPDNAFDLAVVDPPYGDGCSQVVHVERERERESRGTRVHKLGNAGAWSIKNGGNLGGEVLKKIVAWDVAPGADYFGELFRISRNQIIWGGNYFGLPPTRCFLIWRKTNVPLEGFTMASVEYAWTSFAQNALTFEFSAVGQPNRFHPTQKPVDLYAWIYKHFAHEGDKILDTHLGSGSSRIAAYDAGLDFVGYEIDETYFCLQEERFARHTAQTSLFIDEF